MTKAPKTVIIFPIVRFTSNTLTYSKGITFFERVLKKYRESFASAHFIFIFDREVDEAFKLKSLIKNCFITDQLHQLQFLYASGTMGAACTCLLSVDLVPPGSELIIANHDIYLDCSLTEIVSEFRESCDGAVITMDSNHPKWSFLKIDSSGEAIEFREKTPVSRNAIVGFYYFRRAEYFFEATCRMIMKKDMYQGAYYIAQSYNQMILERKKIGYKMIGVESVNLCEDFKVYAK